MKHFKDIQSEINPNSIRTQSEITVMDKARADEICNKIVECSHDIDFKMTDNAYEVFAKIFNSNILNQKGLYVCGKAGIGKSYVFLALRRYEVAIYHPCPVLNVNVREFLEQYKTQGSEYFLQVAQYPRLALHNFGFEGTLNDFGTKRDLIIELIDLRYDRFQVDKNQRTYITSNFNRGYVENLGEVISRRFKAMMNYMEIK